MNTKLPWLHLEEEFPLERPECSGLEKLERLPWMGLEWLERLEWAELELSLIHI